MKKKIIALILCFVLFCAISITAFAEEVFTVHFVTDGGTPAPSPNPQTVPEGNSIAEPDPMTKSNCDFAGWYKEDGTTKWIFTWPVVDNMTLTAHWTPKTDISYPLTSTTSSYGTVVFSNVNDYKTIGEAKPDTSVRVEVNSIPGYTISTVTSADVTLLKEDLTATKAVYSFTMPAKPVNVAVTYDKAPTVTSITLDKDDILLALSDSTGTSLTATTDPLDASVVWDIPNFVTASGTNGKTITIVPKEIDGEGYITATTENKTAKCHIKVSTSIPAADVYFVLPTSTITDKTPFTLTATVKPSSCTKDVYWYASPKDVVKLESDPADSRVVTVTPLKNGDCYITAVCDGHRHQETFKINLISDYAVVYNKNGSWYYDVPTDYTIQTRRPYSSDGISSITITNKYNGIEYKAIEGSDFIATKAKNSNDTVISFYKAFMKELPHYKNQLITVTYKDGTTSKTGLHILSVKDRPITGDTDYSPYIILAAVSAAGLGAVLTLKKKQKV